MYDLIVVGGGVLGTFHAYHAHIKGFKCLVVEKDFEPMSATVRNFGQVVPSGFEVGKWHFYGRYSTSLYKSLQEKGDIGIRNNGSLYVASCKEEMDVLEEMSQRFKDVDYASELYSKEKVLKHSKLFKSSYVYGGLFFEQEVSAEPEKLIHLLQQRMKDQGVDFVYNTQISTIEDTEKGVDVIGSAGDKYRAQKVLVCSGSEFKALYPSVFLSSDLEVTKLQMMSTLPVSEKLPGNILTGLSIQRYESFKSCEAHKLIPQLESEKELKVKGIHILFKQRPDGSIILGDSHAYEDVKTADKLEFSEDNYTNQLMINAAKEIVDLPEIKIDKYWSGYYSQMKCGDIFEHRISDNVEIVTGIGGKGMTASAGYAKERIESLFSLNSIKEGVFSL